MNNHQNKTRINPRIDSKLITIMKSHCCNAKVNEQDFIAHCIAKELKIPLNINFTVDEEYYRNHQIELINNQIECLEAKKKELMEDI